MRAVLRVLLICVLAAPASGWSRERLDADTMARFGGTYSMACGDPSATRLHVLPDALVVEAGNQRMAGVDPLTSYSYFGQSPPPRDFQVALLSQVRGASQLIFLVSRDRVGNYIEVDGAPNVRNALGPSITGRRHRQCDGAAVAGAAPPMQPAAPPTGTVRPGVAAPPPPPPPASGAAGGNPAVLTADPRFGRTWRAMLGSTTREPWIADMNGPRPEPRWVMVGGNRYVLNSFCKPHDCHDNNVVQLYSPGEPRIYALIHRMNRDTPLGDPSPAMAADLRRLWQEQFRPSR